MLYEVIIFAIALESFWDSYQEARLKQRPNYKTDSTFRVIVGFILWIVSPIIDRDMVSWQIWFLPVVMVFMFWFLFDWMSNLFRTMLGAYRPYFYISNRSRIDVWQRNHGGAFSWFWIKLFSVITCIIVEEVIIKYYYTLSISN